MVLHWLCVCLIILQRYLVLLLPYITGVVEVFRRSTDQKVQRIWCSSDSPHVLLSVYRYVLV